MEAKDKSVRITKTKKKTSNNTFLILPVRSLHCRNVVFALHPIGLYIFFNQPQFLFEDFRAHCVAPALLAHAI
jgi:hypothetical protein